MEHARKSYQKQVKEIKMKQSEYEKWLNEKLENASIQKENFRRSFKVLRAKSIEWVEDDSLWEDSRSKNRKPSAQQTWISEWA